MPKLVLALLFLSLPNLSGAAWFGSSIDRNAALCATLLSPRHGIQASGDRLDISARIQSYLTASAADETPLILEPDLERLQELADSLNQRDAPDAGLRAWTFTGRNEIEHYISSLTETRATLENDIKKFEERFGNLKFRSGVAVADALVGLSPLFYTRALFLEASGIVHWAVTNYADVEPLAVNNLVVFAFAATGAFDAPWRFLTTRQKGFAQFQKTIHSFLNGPQITAHWGTRLKISDELIQYLFRSEKISGKALADQNLRERTSGLARLIWDWQRSKRGLVDGQFEADALLWRSPLGESNLTLIVQRTSEPK